MVALKLLVEIITISHVCFKHLKDMGGKVGLWMKTLIASGLQGRLQYILENRNRVGDLKAADDTIQWFRRKNRPPHPADGLGTYKFVPLNLEATFDYDQAALRKRIGGIYTNNWERDGSVNINLFRWWWEIGLIDDILLEFEMYKYYLREMNGNKNWGWLRNMFHSIR